MPFKDAEQKQGYDRERHAANKYTVVGEDPVHFHLRGPSGKVMRVAKTALSPTTTEQIRGYSGASGDPNSQVVAPQVPFFAQPAVAPAVNAAPTVDIGYLPQPQAPVEPPPDWAAQAKVAMDWSESQGVPALPELPAGAFPNPAAVKEQGTGRTVYDPAVTPEMVEQAGGLAKLPTVAGGALPPPAWKPEDDAPEPVPQTPVMLPGLDNGDRDQKAIANFMQGYQASIRGGGAPTGMPGMPKFPALDQDGLPDAQAAALAEGVAKQTAAQRQQAIQQNLMQTQQTLAANRQKIEAERAKGAAARQADIENMKIDPDHYWESRSNAQKTGSIISILLGGLGAGLSRTTENAAMKVIDSAIERDIDAQKANLGKKQNSLSMYLNETKDLREATNLAKADLLDTAATMLKMEASKAEGEQAPLAAAAKVADLKMKAADLRNNYGMAKFNGEMKKAELAAKAAMENAALGVKMMEKNASKIKDLHALKVLMPDDKTYRIANSPEDKTQVVNSLVAYRGVSSTLGQLRKLYNADKTGIWNPMSDKWQEAKYLVDDLIKATASAKEPGGRMSDQDQKFYSEMNGTLLGFQRSPSAYGAKLDTMTRSYAAGLAAQVKQRTQSAEEFLKGY